MHKRYPIRPLGSTHEIDLRTLLPIVWSILLPHVSDRTCNNDSLCLSELFSYFLDYHKIGQTTQEMPLVC